MATSKPKSGKQSKPGPFVPMHGKPEKREPHVAADHKRKATRKS